MEGGIAGFGNGFGAYEVTLIFRGVEGWGEDVAIRGFSWTSIDLWKTR